MKAAGLRWLPPARKSGTDPRTRPPMHRHRANHFTFLNLAKITAAGLAVVFFTSRANAQVRGDGIPMSEADRTALFKIWTGQPLVVQKTAWWPPASWWSSAPLDSPMSSRSKCTPFSETGSCQFYSCRENSRKALVGEGCGPSGYYLRYGLKYCTKFDKTIPHLSSDGKRWVEGARQCLLDYVDRNVAPDTACSAVHDRAFQSHSSCYVNPEHGAPGICELPPTDWIRILLTIEPSEEAVEQEIITKADCIRGWLTGQFGNIGFDGWRLKLRL